MLKNTPTFQNFWDAYGLKRDRIAAKRAWNRLSAKDRRCAMERLAAYKEDCERRGISRMYAQGYLSHRRWEDDYSSQDNTSTTPKAVGKEYSPTATGEW